MFSYQSHPGRCVLRHKLRMFCCTQDQGPEQWSEQTLSWLGVADAQNQLWCSVSLRTFGFCGSRACAQWPGEVKYTCCSGIHSGILSHPSDLHSDVENLEATNFDSVSNHRIGESLARQPWFFQVPFACSRLARFCIASEFVLQLADLPVQSLQNPPNSPDSQVQGPNILWFGFPLHHVTSTIVHSSSVFASWYQLVLTVIGTKLSAHIPLMPSQFAVPHWILPVLVWLDMIMHLNLCWKLPTQLQPAKDGCGFWHLPDSWPWVSFLCATSCPSPGYPQAEPWVPRFPKPSLGRRSGETSPAGPNGPSQHRGRGPDGHGGIGSTKTRIPTGIAGKHQQLGGKNWKNRIQHMLEMLGDYREVMKTDCTSCFLGSWVGWLECRILKVWDLALSSLLCHGSTDFNIFSTWSLTGLRRAW